MDVLYRTLLLLIAFSLPGLTLAQEAEVVVISGTPAPDGNGTIASFITDPSDPDNPNTNSSGPILNDAGQVAFVAYLTDTAGGPGTPSDDSGIFLYDGSAVVQLVREGQASPDGDGVFGLFRPLFEPGLNNTGTVVFHHPLRNSSSGAFFEWGAFAVDTDGGNLSALLREGNPSPDGDGVLGYVGPPALTENGQVGLDGILYEQGSSLEKNAVFRGDLSTGEVQIVAREDAPLPDGDGIYDLIQNADVNEAGQVAFGTTISGSGEVNDQALYRADPDGSIEKIVRFGDPSQSGSGVVYSIPSRPTINDAGQSVYGTLTAGCTSCAPSGADLIRTEDGTSTTIARSGDPAPGGGVFTSFFRPNVGLSVIVPALNEQGQVGFYGTVRRGNLFYDGFYRSDGTEIIRVLEDGQPTPDGQDSFNLGCLAAPAFDCDNSFKMNERGQFAFFTTILNTNPDLNEGIFFYDDALGVVEVVRKGDPFLGSTVVQLRFTAQGSNAHDNARSGLNNHGQVAYVFELADGRSGVAVWSPPPTPTDTPSESVPAAFAIEAAYPNPFRDTATLRLLLPATTAVEFAVYDMLGRRVFDREFTRMPSGVHRVDLDGAALPPGVYIARVTTASGAEATTRLVKVE